MKKIVFTLFSLVILISSCGTTQTSKQTRGTSYAKLYENHPTSILIMPPINKTVNVEAKEYFYTSMAMPLAEKGYYVISPFIAMEFLKNESAYDSEMFVEGNLSAFKEVFGADAVLFTTIEEWSKSTLANQITVKIEYDLKSTTTNETLFHKKGSLTLDLSVQSSSGGLGSLVSLVASAINTALTDKVIAARMCNNYVLKDLPEGKYAPLFEKDKNLAADGEMVSGVVRQ